mmetsp:Transcript_29831/g.92680  ORF Transcript_29831/g.92680 Transcript_29831/m.92680 type:complete len:258 (+) Transcript_29831:5-778(+)
MPRPSPPAFHPRQLWRPPPTARGSAAGLATLHRAAACGVPLGTLRRTRLSRRPACPCSWSRAAATRRGTAQAWTSCYPGATAPGSCGAVAPLPGPGHWASGTATRCTRRQACGTFPSTTPRRAPVALTPLPGERRPSGATSGGPPVSGPTSQPSPSRAPTRRTGSWRWRVRRSRPAPCTRSSSHWSFGAPAEARRGPCASSAGQRRATTRLWPPRWRGAGGSRAAGRPRVPRARWNRRLGARCVGTAGSSWNRFGSP